MVAEVTEVPWDSADVTLSLCGLVPGTLHRMCRKERLPIVNLLTSNPSTLSVGGYQIVLFGRTWSLGVRMLATHRL